MRKTNHPPKQMEFKRVCDAAAFWLRKTDNPAVGHGDAHLLHEIATLMKWKHESWRTERRVLNALSKTPGELIPTFMRHHGLVRNFYLPEHCPERLRPKSTSVGRGNENHLAAPLTPKSR